jgi:hypothetical protein
VRDLQARGFVGLEDNKLVLTDAGKRRLKIRAGTAAMRDSRNFVAPEDLKATGLSDVGSSPSNVSEQHQEAPWEDAASGFEKALEALRTVELDTSVAVPFELSSELMLPDEVVDLAPEIPEEVPRLSPDLGLPPVGGDQGSLRTSVEKLASAIAERHGLGSGEPGPVPLRQVYAWGERRAEFCHGPRFAWLIENIPRRMRAHVPVTAEIRVSSSMAPEVDVDPVGNGKHGLHGIDVAQALSLQLSAPEGGFVIETRSPETRWVWSSNSQSVNELAAWRFIITPTRRGSKSLRLSFSYKEIGPGGLLADGTLPDRLLEVVVSANLPKALRRAAFWITPLIIGAALGILL